MGDDDTRPWTRVFGIATHRSVSRRWRLVPSRRDGDVVLVQWNPRRRGRHECDARGRAPRAELRDLNRYGVSNLIRAPLGYVRVVRIDGRPVHMENGRRDCLDCRWGARVSVEWEGKANSRVDESSELNVKKKFHVLNKFVHAAVDSVEYDRSGPSPLISVLLIDQM